MTCFSPLHGYKSAQLTAKGKRQITFNKSKSLAGIKMTVPCGQCSGCRIGKTKEWALRCVHEAQMHSQNSFITLTYSDKYLPQDYGLKKHHFQKFMKRLRKQYPQTIRYYHCGEYGKATQTNNYIARPHYHACLFNLDFDDKIYFPTKQSIKQGTKLYTSEILTKTWGKGHCLIGDLTWQSAAYVARYIMKKINGDLAEEHYKHFNPETGEQWTIPKEYTTMSRKPGIAKTWLDKYQSDIFPHDYAVLNNKKYKTPRYYDNQYQINHPEEFTKLKIKRLLDLANHKKDLTPERLEVRKTIQDAKIKLLIRGYENND